MSKPKPEDFRVCELTAKLPSGVDALVFWVHGTDEDEDEDTPPRKATFVCVHNTIGKAELHLKLER